MQRTCGLFGRDPKDLAAISIWGFPATALLGNGPVENQFNPLPALLLFPRLEPERQ